MDNSRAIVPPDLGILKCFRSGGKLLVMKHESQSNPSTSASRPSLDKPLIKEKVRDLDSRLSFNVRLINLVKHRRCLYDGNTPGGRNSNYKLQVWDGVARMLNYERGASHLQNRWKQLRDKYVKTRRALGERSMRQQQPFAPNCPWPLYNKLSFLDPFLVERDRSSSPLQCREKPDNTRTSLSSEEVDDFNRRVIRAVRNQPALYSASDPKYRVADQRTAAWHAVLMEINFSCDVYEIQRYWKSIRDRYIRTRRTLGDLCGVNPLKQQYKEKKWNLYEDMLWLEPHLVYQQRSREEFALARQAGDRTQRGSIAVSDERDRVVFDCEVAREDVHSCLLDVQAELLQQGVRFDGDTAFAASVIADIRALPLEQQAHIRAKIEIELARIPMAAEVIQHLQQTAHDYFKCREP